mgnify:FL=1
MSKKVTRIIAVILAALLALSVCAVAIYAFI